MVIVFFMVIKGDVIIGVIVLFVIVFGCIFGIILNFFFILIFILLVEKIGKDLFFFFDEDQVEKILVLQLILKCNGDIFIWGVSYQYDV